MLQTQYPSGLGALSESLFSENCANSACEVGETVTWTLGSLPAGESRTIGLPGVVSGRAADGTTITFDGTVSATGGTASDGAAIHRTELRVAGHGNGS